MATSTDDTVDEAMKQKLLDLGYLIPPQIDSCDQTFTLNNTVLPFEKDKGYDALEAAEHQETARYVEIFDCNGQRLDIEKELLTVHTKKGDVPLSFGNIIALAGDFYMNKESKGNYQPISDVPDFGTWFHPHSKLSPINRFNSAATSLFVDSDGYLKDVHDLITSEHHALHAAIKAGDSSAAVYHDPGHAYPHGSDDHCHIPTEDEFLKATSLSWYGNASSIYAWCAYTNVDHFGEHAIMAYCLGHTRALQLARLAQSKSTDAEKTEQLRFAYAHEAFAAHFLTDLFSSGHLRSPRRPLHNPNYFSMGKKAWEDKVVWDLLCRYMHDDDSATGILVRNELGQQWIEYGDKQFVEPQACVNRARCMACLNESAKEIYNVGFKGNRLLDDDWSKHKDWFAAMKLIPQPMTAITPQNWTTSWGGYDMHNPAPLLLSGHAEAHISEGWTFRNNLNDRSNYGPRQFMSPDESEYGEMVKTGDFSKIGQFPLQSAIGGLLSGGFIQIQDLNAGSGKGTCINFWNPATVEFGDKTESTFTIRNRLINEQIAPTGKLMHWMREPGERTSLAGLSWARKEDNTGDVLMSSTFYSSDSLYKGPSDGTSAPFHVNQSWAVKRQMSRTVPVTILTDVPESALNYTRFVTGNFINGPEILALSQIEKQASIGVSSDTVTYAKVNLPDAPYGFVKTFRGFNVTKDSALLARGGVKEGAKNVELAIIGFDDTGKASMQTAAFDLETEVEQDFSILVGDVLGWGYHQVVAVATNSDVSTIGLYGQSDQKNDIKLCGLHQCELPHDMELVGPILTALMPSSAIEASRKGHDVLQISRQKSGTDSYITFRTHFQQGNGEDPFSGCDESWVHDGLASQGNQHYFSIKWMPVRLEDKTYVRSILEVYSWFGVVGVRVFATGDGVKYDLIGQLPHLGQTSIGAGLGCYGDWGHGFVTWSDENQWVDCNLFLPSDKQDRTVGSWGMTLEDMERPYIAGWDVGSRPLR